MSQVTALMEHADDADLFHDERGQAWATVPVRDHRETMPLRSEAFARWLRYRQLMAGATPPSSQAVADVKATLEARAVYDGGQHQTFLRVAPAGDAVVIDLGDQDWRAIEIRPGGWTVVDSTEVRFRRSPSVGRLPVPLQAQERSFGVDRLRQLLLLEDDRAWRLCIAWLLAAFRPVGPHPLLALGGEQGAAKSTSARELCSLVDPSPHPLRAMPRDSRDLAIAAHNAWVLAFDNVSHIDQDMSDALCRLSTGGGHGTRRLYADDEEVVLDARRPVIITGIGDLVRRSDLLDRSLVVELPMFDDADRRPEARVHAAFERDRPAILGALLDVVADALLRPLPSGVLLPRMADFAAWIIRAEPALGWREGSFLDACRGSRDRAHDVAVQATALGRAVRKLFTSNTFEGTATRLLAVLGRFRPEQGEWPPDPAGLGNALRRLAPDLRATGIVVEFDRETDSDRTRVIRIHPAPASAPPDPVSSMGRPPGAPAIGDPDGPDGSDGSGSSWSAKDAGISPDGADGPLPPWSVEEVDRARGSTTVQPSDSSDGQLDLFGPGAR